MTTTQTILADNLQRGMTLVSPRGSEYVIDYVDPYRTKVQGYEQEHPHVYCQTPDGTELFLGCGEEVIVLKQ